MYCGPTCSQKSRKESHSAADKRYQDTYRGRLNHANRQKCYRERKRKIVTDHSSKESTTNDLLPFVINEDLKIIYNDKLRCHFCGSICNYLLRTSVLGRAKIFIPGVWPLGP